MKKLLGNSLKLPLSELVLDNAGRARICPGGCPASQCLRRLSMAATTEREAAGGLGCCLLQNGSSASMQSAGSSNDNTTTCCVVTGSPQCFLKLSTTSPSKHLPTVSGPVLPPPTANGALPQKVQTAALPCRRNLLHCGCRRLTTMMQSHSMMDSPRVATPITPMAANASATFAAQQEEEDNPDVIDFGARQERRADQDDSRASTKKPDADVRDHANGEETAWKASGAAPQMNVYTRRNMGNEGDDVKRTAASSEGVPTSAEVGPYGTLSQSKCWNCGHKRIPGTSDSLFFCEECGLIQPIEENANYFDIFSLEKKFRLDEKELESRYKGLQKRLHPDLFAAKSGPEKVNSAQQSANVVKAYYTLKRPLSRAIYMVQLESPELGSDMQDGTVQDQSLLMEVMEIRERIEDANSDQEVLKRLADENLMKIVENMEAVATELDAKDYKRAKNLIHRWTYYKRIAEEIDQQI